MSDSHMLFQSWRRSGVYDPLNRPSDGDTDKRFSILSVMLMMLVCSDELVRVFTIVPFSLMFVKVFGRRQMPIVAAHDLLMSYMVNELESTDSSSGWRIMRVPRDALLLL